MDGTIIERKIVTPNKLQSQTIDRLYNKNLTKETVVEHLYYLSENLKVAGYIAYPKKEGKFPVLLWNRGGYKDRGALDDLTAFLILASTAQQGYVVVASQYRGNKGGDGKEDWGGRDFFDALTMLKVAEQSDKSDMTSIGIEGASRGGMTTYRILAEDHRFKCAVIHAGITDLSLLCQQDKEFCRLLDKKFEHLTEDAKRLEMNELSAVHIAERFSKEIPLLLLHGTKDTVIDIKQSEQLKAVLERHNVPHKFIPIQNGSHVALKDGSYKEIDNYRFEWLKKYLG